MRMIWMAALLVLGACSGKSDREPRPPPPQAAVSFGGPLDARGRDPDWGLTVRGGTQMVLSRPGQPDLAVTAPGAVISPHQAAWTAKTPDGQPVTATFYASTCTDAAAASAYPFTVEVDLPGQSPLSGCGGPPAQRSAVRP